jgi:hypothetical protein
MLKFWRWPVCGSVNSSLRHSADLAFIICFATLFTLYRRNKGKLLSWRRLFFFFVQKLLIPINSRSEQMTIPVKSRHTNLSHVLGLDLWGVASCLVYQLCCVTCADVRLSEFAGRTRLTWTLRHWLEQTLSVLSSKEPGSRYLTTKIREPGCFNKWLPHLCSISDGVHIISRWTQLVCMIITRYHLHAEYLQLQWNLCSRTPLITNKFTEKKKTSRLTNGV